LATISPFALIDKIKVVVEPGTATVVLAPSFSTKPWNASPPKEVRPAAVAAAEIDRLC
jgi:hypothetical protein